MDDSRLSPQPGMIVAGGLSLGYGVWQCLPLLDAWTHSRLDAGGAVAFLLWLAGALVLAARAIPGTRCILIGLSAFILAGMTDLHVIRQIGLAFLLAAWITPTPRIGWLVWLAGAAAWMPLFGYLLPRGWETAGTVLRIVLAVISLMPLAVGRLNDRSPNHDVHT